MLALNDTDIQQLIYLSSLSVFSGNSALEITEQTIPQPLSDSDKTIFLGEKICLEYSNKQNYLTHIFRFSELYGASENDYLKGNICTRYCQKMIQDEEIEVFTNKRHYLLHIDDAVDGLYKVMTSGATEGEIYHVVGDEKYSYLEPEIMACLRKEIPYETKVKVVENDQEVTNKKYPNDKIKKLSFREKYKLKDKIGEIYYTILKGEKRFSIIDSEKESLLGRLFTIDSKVKDRILPYVENILFFIILNIFVYFTRTMSFHEVVDVYLLYIVVISLIYGFEQSVFTIMLIVGAKIYLTIYSNIEALTLTNQYMFMWILFIFTIGTMVGYLKEEYKIKYADMTDEKKYLEDQLAAIKEINAINIEVKELYESRLLNYTDSYGRIHEIAAELDAVEPQGIIFKAIRVIQKIMDTEEVSIYIASGNNRFFRLMASSAEKTRELSASPKTSEYIRLFEKMEQKEIYVNTDLDPNYPMMAGGIYKNGDLQSIVMIWSLPLESHNLYQMNIFEVTCRLIESKLNVAYEYMSNINTSYQLKYENMLDEHSFEETLTIYRLGREEGIVEYALLELEKDEALTREEFINRINKNIREADYMFVREKSAQILLTNTDQQGAQLVVNRLKTAGLTVKEGAVIE